ncbi:MAG: transcriptional regulator [Devosia sp.]|nr:transcriptional regulator [Devosia sp.]
MKLNFRELEVIWTVLTEGNASRASQKLNVTQPAVSMMLRQAEARLGFPLFKRSGARLEPTDELLELQPLLKTVFTHLGDLSTQVVRVRNGQLGMLRIATTATLSEAFVTNALYAFQHERPNITASLQSLPSDAVIAGVEQGRIDIGVAYATSLMAQVSSRVVGSAEIVCVMGESDPFTEFEFVTPSDLTKRHLISYRPDTVFGGLLQEAFERFGLRFAPAIETNALSAATLVAQGAGIGLIDGLVVKSLRSASLQARPFNPTVKVDIHLMRSRSERTATVELFEHITLRTLAYLGGGA